MRLYIIWWIQDEGGFTLLLKHEKLRMSHNGARAQRQSLLPCNPFVARLLVRHGHHSQLRRNSPEKTWIEPETRLKVAFCGKRSCWTACMYHGNAPERIPPVLSKPLWRWIVEFFVRPDRKCKNNGCCNISNTLPICCWSDPNSCHKKYNFRSL